MFRLHQSGACLVVLCGWLAFCVVAAQPPEKPGRGKGVNPRALVIEGVNDNAPWMVRVSVDHPDRIYQLGEKVKVTVRSEEKGYLYLFNIDSSGESFCLFPNEHQKDNRIAADRDVLIPQGKFSLEIVAPVGKELIKAIVTKEPLQSLKLTDLTDAKGFKKLTTRNVKALVLEAVTGNKNDGSQEQTVQEIKDKEKQQKPEQFQQQARKWAENQIEIITTDSKPPEAVQKRVGLFIGINKFKDPSIPTLKCSRKDAEDMARTMLATKAVEQARSLLDADATLANIQKAITQDLPAKTQPGDTIVIYWSGHGGRCADTTGKEKDEQCEYLVPHDSLLASEESTMLLNRTFARWIQGLEGRKVIVILDTCHSGGQIAGTKALKGDSLRLARILKPKQTVGAPTASHMLANVMLRAKHIGHKDAVVLASCTPRQYSFERHEEDNGVMTYFLLDFLQKQPGPLTIEQAHKSIAPKVKKYVEDKLEGSSQDPVYTDTLGYHVKPAPQ
jgi:hypothetical protein